MALPLPSTKFQLTCAGCQTQIELASPAFNITLVPRGANVDPRFVCPVCYRTGFVRRNEVTWTGGIRVRGDLVDTLASMPGHRAATKFEVTKDVPQTFQEEVSSTSTSKPPAVREVAPSETPSRDPSTANKAVAPPRSSSGRGGAPAKKTKDDSDEE